MVVAAEGMAAGHFPRARRVGPACAVADRRAAALPTRAPGRRWRGAIRGGRQDRAVRFFSRGRRVGGGGGAPAGRQDRADGPPATSWRRQSRSRAARAAPVVTSASQVRWVCSAHS